MYVKEKFVLNTYTKDILNDLEPIFGYDGYGEFVFYRTYSRTTKEDKQENWSDVIIRVVEGTFSIRKDWYLKNYISWNETYWQEYATRFAISMFNMEWLPPGRGLWAMGTDFIYERGGMALYNCSYTAILDDLAEDFDWFMDSLMLGCGVGFSPYRNDNLKFKLMHAYNPHEYIIPDTREGWTKSIYLQLKAAQEGIPQPRFIYDEIRGPGLPIRGFGGLSSGPQPLIDLHCEIPELIDNYMTDPYYDSVILKTDIANLLGVCTVAGNVRRSAELGSLSIKDPTFRNLKNYKLYPDRAKHGWMSNNSVDLEDDDDFEQLDKIAESIKQNGEPGFKNLRNFRYGRIGKETLKEDRALGTNPCAEIQLEGLYDYDGIHRVREVCNVDETYPTICNNPEIWINAAEYATFYASTVSLLPTHQPSTNRVVARNRRIGVSIVDYTGWIKEAGLNKVTKWMRRGYDKVTKVNKRVNAEAGIPEAIRKTCIKPGGTTPKLPGKTPGIGYPTFRETYRRTNVAKNHPMVPLLIEANIPYEENLVDKSSLIFGYPITQGPSKPAYETSLWEQAFNLVTVQREWADNSVSNTLYFKPKWVLHKVYDDLKNPILTALDDLKDILNHNDYITFRLAFHNEEEEIILKQHKITISYNQESEDHEILNIKTYNFDNKNEEDDIEPVLSSIAPLIKSVSLLPHSANGAYAQMPEEGISIEQYNELKKLIKKVDWSKLKGSDGIDERYCQGDVCTPLNK